MQEFDHIIVGAGTAGCLLANRLSADPSRKVLLIEAGRSDNYHWIHIPVGYLYCIGNPRTDWLYRTEADPGLNGRSLLYPRGKTLGGCSSINGMIYMRGQARDYDQWAELTGEEDWSWERSLPDFMGHESHYRLDAEDADPEHRRFHGHGKERRVEKQRLRWEILDAFAQAATQTGIPETSDFNRGTNEGVGYFEVNQRSGWRWNATKAFLRPVMSRPNLTVWTETQVEKLHLDHSPTQGWQCTGAQLRRKGQSIAVKASRGVVLAAGAIGSVQVLELSGIGSRQTLGAAGVEVKIEHNGVGANLQDHLQIRAVYEVEGVKTLNTQANSLWGKAAIGLEYLFKRSGPMSMAPSQMGGFTRSDDQREWPNIEFHVQPLSLDAFGQPLHRFNAFTASVCNLNPSSRGTVHIKSPDCGDAPAIAPNYLSTVDDQKVAADSLRVARNIVAQPALKRYNPREIKPGIQYQTDQELVRLAGDIATTIFHPVGTTKMGKPTDPMAVVNPHLQALDGQGATIRGLHIADAGVMPTITSGNTNSPTLLIAEKAARWILAST